MLIDEKKNCLHSWNLQFQRPPHNSFIHSHDFSHLIYLSFRYYLKNKVEFHIILSSLSNSYDHFYFFPVFCSMNPYYFNAFTSPVVPSFLSHHFFCLNKKNTVISVPTICKWFLFVIIFFFIFHHLQIQITKNVEKNDRMEQTIRDFFHFFHLRLRFLFLFFSVTVVVCCMEFTIFKFTYFWAGSYGRTNSRKWVELLDQSLISSSLRCDEFSCARHTNITNIESGELLHRSGANQSATWLVHLRIGIWIALSVPCQTQWRKKISKNHF